MNAKTTTNQTLDRLVQRWAAVFDVRPDTRAITENRGVVLDNADAVVAARLPVACC